MSLQRLRLGQHAIGWLDPAMERHVAAKASVSALGLTLADPDALAQIAAELVKNGTCPWRGEAFDIRADGDGAVLGRIDRGALPPLGMLAHNAHLNGLVRQPDGLHVWVARRSAQKLVAPGKLDHIVAGGIPAGLDARATLIKEAAEEAGIPAALAERAVAVGTLSYAMRRPEGLRRETLHCFDVDLPASFVPKAMDGEVAEFMLWPIGAVLERLRTGDDFIYDANLALIDLMLRHSRITGVSAVALRQALDAIGAIALA